MKQQETYQGQITGFYILSALVIVIVIPLLYLYSLTLRGLALAAPDGRVAPGFLKTGASFASDVSLLAYIIVLVPLMIIGFAYARGLKFGRHKLVMTTVTVVNWAIILYLMAVSYSGAATFYGPTAPSKLILPTIHLLTGLTAQTLATVSLIRMWLEARLPGWLRYEPIKPQMRITLGLWIITALLGISIYITWYGIPLQARPGLPSQNGTGGATPAATGEATSEATGQATGEATSQAQATTEATDQATVPAPAASAEASPAATP